MKNSNSIKFLVIDPRGFVVACFLGGNAAEFKGKRYSLIHELPLECRSVILEMLSSSALDRESGRVARVVQANEETIAIILLETIQIERSECDLRKVLGEWLFKLSHNAKDAGIQLSVTISRDIPERVLIDANKFIWVGKSLIQSAIHAVPRGMFFGRGGGMVRVALTYHADLLSITVEDDGGERTEECLEEPSFHGPSGRMNGAGKFARDIVESHGGMMVWEKATFGAEQKRGTRVSITVPARSALPLGALKFDY